MKTKVESSKIKLKNGIYAIAGICKNCGKTSLMNSLLAQIKHKQAGVLTTGRDGEEKDVLYGNPKPAVKLRRDMLFTSTPDAVEKQRSAVEVLSKLPFHAANKQLLLLKALRDIETEITGPASAADQIAVASMMKKLGAEIVFIDGSLDRKSIVLNPKVNGVFIVVGSSYGSLEKIKAELSRLVRLSYIPRYMDKNLKAMQDNVSVYKQDIWVRTGHATLMGHETEIASLLKQSVSDKLYLPGAVTDSMLTLLQPALRSVQDLIVRHPLNLQLSPENLNSLFSNHRLTCLSKFVIVAIAVNSWSVKGSHLDSKILRDTIRREFSALPVIDIYE
ncbi:MAG: hypothetical protein R6V77_02020 [Candidatus Cloacimonadaceae bacterium]